VDIDPTWDGDAHALHDAFVARHRQLYGHGDADALVELVTLRCRGVVPGEELRPPRWTVTTGIAPRSERPVFFRESGGAVSTRVFDRESLAVDQPILGPAIIEEWNSTTLVPPGWVAHTDQEGNLVLTRQEPP
jgi:N-methylhydantoinase A